MIIFKVVDNKNVVNVFFIKCFDDVVVNYVSVVSYDDYRFVLNKC